MQPVSFLSHAGLWLFVTALIAGCGDGKGAENTASVNGTVTFEKKAITAGEIHLYNADRGIGPSAKIENGRFQFPDRIPPGTYKVSVLPPQPEGEIDPSIMPPEYPGLPPKYRSETTSDLVAKITEGDNTLEYDLKP